MSDKYSDSYHKMSKKIAQLTKVIFHLHTKNEENEELTKAFKNTYEREIEGIIKETNVIISKQKEAIRLQKDNTSMSMKIKELQEKQEADKARVLSEVNTFKSQVTEREAKIIKDKEETLRQLKSSIETIKEKYEAKLSLLNESAGKNENLRRTIEELKRLHQAEIENHVKESNKKYNDLLNQKIMNEEKLIEKFEKEKANIIAGYEKQIKELLKKAVGEEKERLEVLLDQQVIL